MKPFDKKAELRREQRPRWWLFGIIVILILAISVVTVVNVGHLEKTIDKRTNAYMKDVSLEVAKNIDYRLAKVTENLTMLDCLLYTSCNLKHTVCYFYTVGQGWPYLISAARHVKAILNGFIHPVVQPLDGFLGVIYS